MREAGVSRITAREAIKHLRGQGLVVTKKGRGAFVWERRPVRVRNMSRYLIDADPHGAESSFTHDQRISWDDYALDRDFRVVAATTRQAELLETSEGAEVLERHCVFRSKGDPTQTSVSCYPYELVKGTRSPTPGTTLARWQHRPTAHPRVTRVTEQAISRRPTLDEADVLGLRLDDPVIAIVRRMFVDARPVESADIVIPAEQVQLEYEINAPRSK